nr:hypothetical protein I308_06256 [Cryptococcus tetragattii IND107]
MTTYELAQYSWNDPEFIAISSYDNKLIGTFPLGFVKRGGLNTWAFVSDIVHQLVDVVGGGVIMAKDGNPVALQEAPYAGVFVFVPRSEQCHATDKQLEELTVADEGASISFARGPEFFRKGIAPNPDGSQSTRSNSKRSTVQQLYRDILNIPYEPPMFAVSAGLLLRDDIHHAFDRLELSFYFQVS